MAVIGFSEIYKRGEDNPKGLNFSVRLVVQTTKGPVFKALSLINFWGIC